ARRARGGGCPGARDRRIAARGSNRAQRERSRADARGRLRVAGAPWWRRRGRLMLSARRLAAVARKEWIQLRRDVRSMVLAFVLPPFMLLFFGSAINWDIRELPIAVVDRDVTAHSRRLVESFEASGYFTVTERPATMTEVDALLLDGSV